MMVLPMAPLLANETPSILFYKPDDVAILHPPCLLVVYVGGDYRKYLHLAATVAFMRVTTFAPMIFTISPDLST
jgi:hypothetical protein